MPRFISEKVPDGRANNHYEQRLTPEELKKRKGKVASQKVMKYREGKKNIQVFLREDVAGYFRAYCKLNKISHEELLNKIIYNELVRPLIKEQHGVDIPFEESTFTLDLKTVPKKNKFLPDDWNGNQ